MSILFPIRTTNNPKPISQQVACILKRTCPSMKKLKSCVWYHLLPPLWKKGCIGGRLCILFVRNWKSVEFQKNVIAIERRGHFENSTVAPIGTTFTRVQRVNLTENLGSTVTSLTSPGCTDVAFKIHFFGDEIEELNHDPTENQLLEKFDRVTLFPANMFVTSPDS